MTDEQKKFLQDLIEHEGRIVYEGKPATVDVIDFRGDTFRALWSEELPIWLAFSEPTWRWAPKPVSVVEWLLANVHGTGAGGRVRDELNRAIESGRIDRLK